VTRYLAAVSLAFGNSRTVQAFVAASDWNKPWQAGKPRETNTLLALRGLANMFSTATGRETMAKIAGEILAKLKQREWSELGPRKLPFSTILLK
jgi:phospholipase A-2-activating protein